MSIKGIEIKSLNVNSTYPYTGLNISDNVKTKLTLENFKFTKEDSNEKMVFLANNIDILNWKKVVFSGLESDDLFSLPYPL